jgi:NADH-quinone oxidoreductase subunit A
MAFWPMAVYFAAVVALVGAIMTLSWLLGQRHRERATGDPYESGMIPEGSARVRLPIKFHLVAMFFVIFDLEAAFLIAWAVAVPELGWTGFAGAAGFVFTLGAALAYIWRLGGLDWGEG